MKKLGNAPRTKLGTLNKTGKDQIRSLDSNDLALVQGGYPLCTPPWGGPNDAIFDITF